MENISGRLVSARKIAGISLQELADRMETKKRRHCTNTSREKLNRQAGY